jgi:predicted acyl esterase
MKRTANPIPLLRMAIVLLSLPLLAQGAARAQIKPSLMVMVPMGDGTRLATDIYFPSGAGPWPVALLRTPFDKNTMQANPFLRVHPSDLVQHGIAAVVQDTRGRFASEGQARLFVNEAWGEHPDGADTVAWIRQQSWSNGKIATFGPSYMGSTQYLLAGAGPEGIVGQDIVTAPVSLYHSWVYQNGVFRKAAVEDFVSGTGWPPEALELVRQHPSYDDFWRGLDLGTRLEQVRWPILHLGGWFDVFTQGTIDAFTQLQEHGGEGAQGRQHLVVGPWTHLALRVRQVGQLTFPKNATFPPGAPDELQWLSFWLTGQPQIPAEEPAVRYYVMGDVTDPQAPGNLWRAADHWPPPSRPLRLYLTVAGGLEPQPPATATARAYDYDPAQPVPTVGGQELFLPAGPRDQRSVEGRPDVLVFSTPPLTEPLEVTGRISVRLSAATSAQDTDFTAKLTDVYPDGRSMLVTDGIVRARYRMSLSQAAPIKPGEHYAYDIDLGSTSIVFNRGHRIRVDISSSNAPRFEPNLNTGGPLPIEKDDKPVVAHQTITLGGAEASHIVLPEVVGGGQP